MAGAYIVYPYPKDEAEPEDIAFQIVESTVVVSPEQSSLKSEAERTLIVLRGLLGKKDPRFRAYFEELLALTRYGLVSDAAQPEQAMRTLKNLQQRIFDSEKGAAITTHMTKVLLSAVFFIAAIIAVIGALNLTAHYYAPLGPLKGIANYVWLSAPGLALGLIFSAFIRCRAVSFYDLHAIDADRFSAAMRAAFALVVLIVVAVFMKAGAFEIVIGSIKLSEFDSSLLSAFLLGTLVGLAQEPFIARIEASGKQAGSTATETQAAK